MGGTAGERGASGDARRGFALRALAYVDSSALVKLAAGEPEAEALHEALAERASVASDVAWVEVVRATRRAGADEQRAHAVLAEVRPVALTHAVVARAAALDPPALRTLDAIHVASALILGGDLAALVTYDRRLADAAAGAGLPVEAPA